MGSSAYPVSRESLPTAPRNVFALTMSSLVSTGALAPTRVSPATPRVPKPHAVVRGATCIVRFETKSDCYNANTISQRCASLAAACVLLATPSPAFAASKPPTLFIADLVPTKGHENVKGTITFESALNKSNQEVVFVTPSIDGLSPGAHGVNVHEFSGEGVDGIGSSFNPDGRPHGSPTSIKKFGASACHFVGEGCQWNRHAGDLGNIEADGNGSIDASKKFKDLYVSLNQKKEMNIVGQAVVVHARGDDFKTEKDDGDAGEVVAFGVIKAT